MKAVLMEEHQEKKLDINNEGGQKSGASFNIIAPISEAFQSGQGSALEKPEE